MCLSQTKQITMVRADFDFMLALTMPLRLSNDLKEKEVFTLLHEFLRIPSGKSEFCGIPWNFYGKHLAGASAIWGSISMDIPTFFQGIPMEMVGIREPPGTIPMGIH